MSLTSALAVAVACALVGTIAGFALCRCRHRWCPDCGQTLRCPDCTASRSHNLGHPAQARAPKPAGRRWSISRLQLVHVRRADPVAAADGMGGQTLLGQRPYAAARARAAPASCPGPLSQPSPFTIPSLWRGWTRNGRR